MPGTLAGLCSGALLEWLIASRPRRFRTPPARPGSPRLLGKRRPSLSASSRSAGAPRRAAEEMARRIGARRGHEARRLSGPTLGGAGGRYAAAAEGRHLSMEPEARAHQRLAVYKA